MKKYANYLVSCSLSVPLMAQAVTLGNLTVNSSLNQPMNAYIRLTSTGNTPLSGIKVKLADPDAFKRAGIPRPYSLAKLQFSIEKLHGKPIVKVKSLERIEEPYIQFLLDVTWAKGQYYRAYTLLLDPPGYKLALSAVQKSKRPKRPKRPGVKHKPISTSVIRSPMPVNETMDIAEVYGPTNELDDLWKIAQRYKSQHTTINQVMLAIIAYNPRAFVSNNVNGLKRGVKLKIPSYRIIATIPARNAYGEVKAHMLAWKQKTPIDPQASPHYLYKRKYFFRCRSF